MKLVYSETSPYVRTVRVVAAYLGLNDQIELVASDRSDVSMGICAENPLGKVPTLITADHGVIYDSMTIVDYFLSLVDHNLQPDPESGAPYWRARTLCSLANGTCDFSYNLVKSRLLPEAERSPSYEVRQLNGVNSGIKAMSDALPELTGPSIASIAVACALDYVVYRQVSPGWQDQYPELKKWLDQMVAQDTFKATAPPPTG